MRLLLTTAMCAALGFGACQNKDVKVPNSANVAAADTVFAANFQEMLLDAQPGDVIEIPAGVHSFDRSLSLTVDGVILRGAGMDKTVLTFKNQVAGAEGLLVTANDFTIENLTMQDSKGDLLKVNEGKNIVIRNVKAEWTGGHKTSNGAYGLYPVQCENVLIDGAVAIGASDAGIYVGQSRNIIVRNSRAEYNVAGIEIENSIKADVHNNVTTNNTGGILVFNMPSLEQRGYHTRVYDNQIFENNTKNFGHKGTPVASVPAGSGIVINSNDNVEIFQNDIRDNKTANIIISAIYSTGYSDMDNSDAFDGYPEGIYIYDNQLSGGGNSPDGMELKALKVALFGINGSLPDVLWDGYLDKDKLVDGQIQAANKICIQNEGVEVLNADGPNGYKSPKVNGREDHNCKLVPLEPADVSL